jgi:ribose transport system substrate-binding protein
VRGESVTAEIPTDATIVTADNVDDPEVQAVLYVASC